MTQHPIKNKKEGHTKKVLEVLEAVDNHVKTSDEVNSLFKDLEKNAPCKITVKMEPSPRLYTSTTSPKKSSLSPPAKGKSYRTLTTKMPSFNLSDVKRGNTFCVK